MSVVPFKPRNQQRTTISDEELLTAKRVYEVWTEQVSSASWVTHNEHVVFVKKENDMFCVKVDQKESTFPTVKACLRYLLSREYLLSS